jgi:hypothetical protein
LISQHLEADILTKLKDFMVGHSIEASQLYLF